MKMRRSVLVLCSLLLVAGIAAWMLVHSVGEPERRTSLRSNLKQVETARPIDMLMSGGTGWGGIRLSEETRRRLRSIGYIDEGGTGAAVPPVDGPTAAREQQITRMEDRTAEMVSRRPPAVTRRLERLQRGEAVEGSVPRASRDIGKVRLTLTSSFSPDDEIWVIARLPEGGMPRDEDSPGTGALLAKLPGEGEEVPVSLKHTDVKAALSGYIATVDVTQNYENPYSEKIEAVYVFPLPENAAVSEFVMTVGERRIRGIIREREEAEKIYREARSQGYVASLLTQERPNIFTQRIANIDPGKAIDINIRYFNTLAYVDGWYEFVFPMVVGPRYNPQGSTDGVGAVARGEHGLSGQSTEVQYLAPGERSGHDISVTVELDAGVAIEELVSKSHVTETKRESPERARVSLGQLDRIPNKDFILRYRVAGETVKSALVTHRDERGGFFTLMLYPPRDLASLQRRSMEMVFVLDCSGSMSGQPIAQAKAAVVRALHSMREGDTFQVIRFSNNASQFGPDPVPATPENMKRAVAYVESLNGSGGTEMIEGIKAALDFPHDAERLRVVTFLTDGYIGNETEILAAVRQKIRDSRVFSFGVGSSVNRYLLDEMAKVGRGAAAYLGLNDSASEVMDLYFSRISHAALTDISIDWGGMRVTDVYPSRMPDLFVGRPVILTGRCDGDGATEIRISGRAAGETRTETISVDLDSSAKHDGLASVWARTKIADLSRRALTERGEDFASLVRGVALEYGLMSQFTAFVAVDSLTRTEAGSGTTVAVPVPVPEGVRYETTVME